MKRSSFIYGSILLTIVSFLIRIISFTYDVTLSKLIGAEGIGMFQMIMPVLMILLIISTGGIPTAVSILVAENNSKHNYYAVKRIYKIAVLFTLIISTLIGLVLILSARYISLKIFKTENVLLCLYFLAPAIIIISMTSVIRGYYYGLKMMGTASLSEIIEHSTRFVFVLSLLYYFYPVNPLQGALIAIIGISIGEIFDLIWLIFVQKRFTKKLPYTIPAKISTASILSRILHIAGPLTISSLFNVLLQSINAILIPYKLISSGYTNSEAIASFGRIMGMAIPLIYLPFIVTSALVINIIPSLSEQISIKNYRNARHDILFAIKITLLVSIPLTTYYIFFSEQLAIYLYNDIQVSRFIHIMGYNTIFLALQHTFSGILNGLGKQINTTIHRLIGMIFQIICIYYLIGNPLFGINGYFIGFFLSAITIFLLDSYTLWRITKFRIEYINLLLKPIIAATFMIMSLYISLQLLYKWDISNAIAFFSSTIIGGFCYISILYITKVIPFGIQYKNNT